MRSFDRFMNFKALEPLIMEAATLLVRLDIDPREYLLEDENYWANARNSLGTAASQAGQAGMNLFHGLRQAGQGVRNWWQQLDTPDRKLEKAASLIQGCLNDPNVSAMAGGEKQWLMQVITQLRQISASVATNRKGTPSASSPPTPGGPTPPPPPGGP